MSKDNQDFDNLFQSMQNGNIRALAKLLTAIENEHQGIETVLEKLKPNAHIPVIGITGPPGAGKSSLINCLAEYWAKTLNLKVAILAIDPSSPFNLGALLGDRLRMSGLFTNKNIFIRSFASRGALGGLASRIVEATDLMRNANIDRIIIETVGVGQSEIEIAGLADTTVLVLVPEAGDDIQAIKSGIMEIADIFVVNKADREGAAKFHVFLQNSLNHRKTSDWNPPIIETISTQNIGIEQLSIAIDKHIVSQKTKEKQATLLAERAWKLIAEKRMKDVSRAGLENEITSQLQKGDFNLYALLKKY
ncbi:MAG: methylmalonyl Co-A mutase-associated GTPase MeaB [Bacteroidia bacterium]|nr:methylmalonyl Co-A mutase-associated GTPase MeaB [Bacteroidia bacterium]